MANQRNTNQVAELTDKVTRAKSLMFADYRGLTHKQLEDLRKKVKKVQGDFVVTKNTLLFKALTNAKAISESFKKTDEPTATIFAYEDAVEPLKEFVKFLKTSGFGSLKGGIMDGKVLTVGEVTRISTLPGRSQLLSKLVGQLQAPLYGLHNALSWNMRKLVWVLDSVKSKK